MLCLAASRKTGQAPRRYISAPSPPVHWGQAKSALSATLDTQGNIQGKITVADGILNLPEAKISSFTGEAAFALAALQLQHIKTELALSGIKLSEKESAKPISEQAGKNPAALTLRDAAIDHITLKGDIRGLPDSWVGELDLDVDGGQLTAGTLNIQKMTVSLPIIPCGAVLSVIRARKPR